MGSNKFVIMYKLVKQNYTTHSNTKWEIGVKVIANGIGDTMGTNAVIHCYSNPYLAILFNPIHANICNPRLIKVSCSKIIANDGLKQGCKEQTMIEEIPLPVLSTLQKVEFAIRCAMLYYKEKEYVLWATSWLNGKDRSKSAAEYAAWSAVDAARSAGYAAEYAAWSAVEYAAGYAVDAARSAWSAVEYAAGYAAVDTARSAGYAAGYAANTNQKFVSIITQIMENSNAK